MPRTPDSLPDDVDALKAALTETRARLSGATALIEHLQLVIAKMKRERFGPRSERSQRLLDQMELQLEDLVAAAGEDESKAEAAGVRVQGFTRRPATRRNFPAHLPRRRIVHPAPTSCPCCGGSKLSKIGEDITETLDVVPRQWFVTEHVREKFSCRSCETITQPPAPFHVIARGFGDGWEHRLTVTGVRAGEPGVSLLSALYRRRKKRATRGLRWHPGLLRTARSDRRSCASGSCPSQTMGRRLRSRYVRCTSDQICPRPYRKPPQRRQGAPRQEKNTPRPPDRP